MNKVFDPITCILSEGGEIADIPVVFIPVVEEGDDGVEEEDTEEQQYEDLLDAHLNHRGRSCWRRLCTGARRR